MELQKKAGQIVQTFGEKETEHNWEATDKLYSEFIAVIKRKGILNSSIIDCVKTISDVLISTLSSERTRLVLKSLELVAIVAGALREEYELLQEFFIYSLLKLSERTSKIIAKRAKETLLDLLRLCQSPMKVIANRLCEFLSSPNKNGRECVIDCIFVILEHSPKTMIDDHQQTIALIISKCLEDSAEPVRATSRKAFTVFARLFPQETAQLTANLSANVLKALNLHSNREEANRIQSKLALKSFIKASKKTNGPQRVVQPLRSSTNNTPKGTPSSLPTSKTFLGQSSRLSQRSMSRILSACDEGEKAGSKSFSCSAQINSAPETKSPTKTLLAHLDIPIKINPKQIVMDFCASVKSPEWDGRYKAILEFTKNLSNPQTIDFITSSQSIVHRIFIIFYRGLHDIHFKVVFAILEYGKILFNSISMTKLPNPFTFVSDCILRLFVAATNVQFKAKQMIIDDCALLVGTLGKWLNNESFFLDALVSALTHQDAPRFPKARIAIVARISVLIEGVENTDDFDIQNISLALRKIGHLLDDKDPNIVDSCRLCFLTFHRKFKFPDIFSLAPSSQRASLEIYFDSLMDEELLCIDSPVRLPVDRMPTSPKLPSSSSFDETVERVNDQDPKLEIPSNQHKPLYQSTTSFSNESFVHEEIMLDDEIFLVKRIPTAPATPKQSNEMVVDFNTPRSMGTEMMDDRELSSDSEIKDDIGNELEDGEIIENNPMEQEDSSTATTNEFVQKTVRNVQNLQI